MLVLPLTAAALWLVSLQNVDPRQMNDLGLASVLPPLFYLALGLLIASFLLNLRQPRVALVPMLLQTFVLVMLLYGTPMLVETTPRLHVTWRHAGFAEFIQRTGTINPYLESYFNWPGFFALAAFLSRAAGFENPIELAKWASVFFNLIYLAPLLLIWRVFSRNEKLIWMGVWLFYVSNWVGQDHFAPQALGFFFYALIVGVLLFAFQAVGPALPALLASGTGRLSSNGRSLGNLLTRFRPSLPYAPPLRPFARGGLLIAILLVFGAMVSSHQLSPFFALATVTSLVVLNLVNLRGLPLILCVMLVAWLSFLTVPFLAGHTDMVVGNVGRVDAIVSANVLNRLQGSPEHIFVVRSRIVLTAVLAGVALLGALRRIRNGHWDVAAALLAVMPFALLVFQSYGGEMLLRVLLFALPGLVFFAAALFFPDLNSRGGWGTLLAAGILLLGLTGGFLIARYGNERIDYFTEDEVAGMEYLYDNAAPDSLILTFNPFLPAKHREFEKYRFRNLEGRVFFGDTTHLEQLVLNTAEFMAARRGPSAYFVLTHSQQAHAELFNGMPTETWAEMQRAYQASPKFELVFTNADAQIFRLR